MMNLRTKSNLISVVILKVNYYLNYLNANIIKFFDCNNLKKRINQKWQKISNFNKY